jgi:hypothetical protein
MATYHRDYLINSGSIVNPSYKKTHVLILSFQDHWAFSPEDNLHSGASMKAVGCVH